MKINKKFRWALIFAILVSALIFGKYIYYAASYGQYLVVAGLSQPSGSCLDAQFSVEESNKSITCEVKISRDATYQLNLSFVTDKKDRDQRKRVQDIVDPEFKDQEKRTVEHVVPLSLSVLIESKDGNVIKQEKEISPKVFAYGRLSIKANILRLKLNKGDYKITVKTVAASPKFSGIITKIQLLLFMPK